MIGRRYELVAVPTTLGYPGGVPSPDLAGHRFLWTPYCRSTLSKVGVLLGLLGGREIQVQLRILGQHHEAQIPHWTV